MKNKMFGKAFWICLACMVSTMGFKPVNSPYPNQDREANILYRTIITEVGKTDPATYYSGLFIFDVLEPPFEYHPLKRPYELIPLTARAMPRAEERVIQLAGKKLDAVIYPIEIRTGIRYQDHPCFVAANHQLTAQAVKRLGSVRDLPGQGTRELKAGDFVLGICRLADPRLVCPIYSILEKNMLGMGEYRLRLEAELKDQRTRRRAAAGLSYNQEADEEYNPIRIDYLALAGDLPFVRETGPYSYELALRHPYPQILSWMAFSFFAPVPQEALDFYSQRVLLEKGFTMNSDLIGTGPYILEITDPINQVVLTRNRHYRPAVFPSLPRPDPDDPQAVANYQEMQKRGMLDDCGKRIPFIDKVVYRMEKESIPRWNKFLQGYYDESSVQAELFDETVQLSSKNGSVLTPELETRGIRMVQARPAATGWIFINMSDPVVGGYTEDKCKLRQALSIACDSEEEIELLRNGIGLPAQNIIPPGIFGQTLDRGGINHYVYNWDEQQNRPVRKSLDEARQLLAEAGYPGGVGKDGKQLVVDYMISGMTPDIQAQIALLRRNFNALNVELKVSLVGGGQYNRSRDAGDYQLCGGGWGADYPDPENFLFLYNSPKPGEDGNKTGFLYYNPIFSELYPLMQRLPNSPERLAVIRQMLEILAHDAPSIFKSHAVSYSLYHDWLHNANSDNYTDRIKYLRLDPEARRAYRDTWNQPRFGRAALFILILLVLAIPAVKAGIKQFKGA